MLLPVNSEFCIEIFLVFHGFYPTSGIFLLLWFLSSNILSSTAFYHWLFFFITSFHAIFPQTFQCPYLLFPSPLPSPVPCLDLLFISLPPYFFSTFSYFSFPCDFQPAKKCYTHRLFSHFDHLLASARILHHFHLPQLTLRFQSRWDGFAFQPQAE